MVMAKRSAHPLILASLPLSLAGFSGCGSDRAIDSGPTAAPTTSSTTTSSTTSSTSPTTSTPTSWRRRPYAERPGHDTTNDTDGIFSTGGEPAEVDDAPDGDGYRAAICLVLPALVSIARGPVTSRMTSSMTSRMGEW
jgi:hypothetical protein